jgi:hypothetical protein
MSLISRLFPDVLMRHSPRGTRESTSKGVAERRRVFVARSRHNNGVERNRGAGPYGILRRPAPLGKNICEMMRGVPVIRRSGQSGENPDAGWDPRAARRGGSRWPAMVSGRRVDGWEEATGPGTRGPDDAGMGKPHGGSMAHGGPLWRRGSRRITTSQPGPQCRQS